jgi:hypothetical protein
MTKKPSYSKLKNKVKNLKTRLGRLKKIEKNLRKREIEHQTLIRTYPVWCIERTLTGRQWLSVDASVFVGI